jgi:hypothetical protein
MRSKGPTKHSVHQLASVSSPHARLKPYGNPNVTFLAFVCRQRDLTRVVVDSASAFDTISINAVILYAYTVVCHGVSNAGQGSENARQGG